MKLLNTSGKVITGTVENEEMIVEGDKVLKYDAVELQDASLKNVTIIGDGEKNKGEGHNGIVITKGDNSIQNSDISNFGGYGVVTSNGKTAYRIPVSYKNMEKMDEEHVHLIKKIDISRLKKFEIGYTLGYMGYKYCSTRQLTVRFYNDKDQLVQETQTRQFDKLKVPEGAVAIDLVIKQNKVPAAGDTDFNGAVFFITDYDMPSAVMENNKIHGNNRENIALCGGRDLVVKGNEITDTWIGLCIEDGWELTKNVTIEGNTFTNNGRDMIIASGRDLKIRDNYFTGWVNIQNRVDGLIFTGNTIDISKEGHEKQNDRFVCEFHNTTAEISHNTYRNVRIVFSQTKQLSDVSIHDEHYIDTNINAMPKEMKVKDSVIEYQEHGGRITGIYEKTKLKDKSGREIYMISTRLKDCEVTDVSKFMVQQASVNEGTRFTNVKIEVNGVYPDSYAEFYDCILNDVTIVPKGNDLQPVHMLFENCEFNLSRPLMNVWSATGVVTLTFKKCTINAVKALNYFLNISWPTAHENEWQIIFEDCTFIGEEIKELITKKGQKYVLMK